MSREAEPLVEKDVEIGRDAKKSGLRRQVERVFAHDHNPKFAERAEHAARGACVLRHHFSNCLSQIVHINNMFLYRHVILKAYIGTYTVS